MCARGDSYCAPFAAWAVSPVRARSYFSSRAPRGLVPLRLVRSWSSLTPSSERAAPVFPHTIAPSPVPLSIRIINAPVLPLQCHGFLSVYPAAGSPFNHSRVIKAQVFRPSVTGTNALHAHITETGGGCNHSEHVFSSPEGFKNDPASTISQFKSTVFQCPTSNSTCSSRVRKPFSNGWECLTRTTAVHG